MTRAVFLVLALTTSGCTIIGTDSVPDQPPSREVDCSGVSGGGVVLDVLMGAPSAVVAFSGIGDKSTSEVVIGGLLTTAFAASIYGGIKRGNQCDAAKARHRAWLAEQDEAVPRPRLSQRARLAAPIAPPLAADEPLPDTAPIPHGRLDGLCYGNLSCDAGLHCDLETRRCAPGAVGSLAAPCFANQTCEPGLQCQAGVCDPP